MAAIKPLTILLAEDNQDHAELIIDTLVEFNKDNRIIHVLNGEQVLQYLRREAPYDSGDVTLPDLILMDLKMPRLDGASALRSIRDAEAFRHIPVTIVSTSSNEKEIKTCLVLGANSYITKPLAFEDFSRKIQELNLYWASTTELPANASQSQ